MTGMQRVLSLVYPDQCLLCRELVDRSGGLCAGCWRDMPFLRGLVCDTCGVSLPGPAEDIAVHCDDCLKVARPWVQGRAALGYRGGGRRLVLALKHGDRSELAGPISGWMAAAGAPFLTGGIAIVPVPLHWTRLLRRRYNQSAELGRALAARLGLTFLPSALMRTRRTIIQDDLGADARFANVANAIAPHPKHGQALAGRDVCLVDDVMTSGATLSEATAACHEAGARRVSVLVLARVEKSP